MLASNFLSMDDGVRSLPIACRLVPFDQWLVTHVDTSWKVKDMKQWILSKCNAWGSTTAPQVPRFRPASPVTFSAPSRRSSLDSTSWAGTDEDDDLEEHAEPEGERRLGSDSGNTSGRTIPSASSSTLFYPAFRHSQVNDHDAEQAATIARYVVVSFSNGFMLDDEAILSWYKFRPLELLEVHRSGSIVSLPRKSNNYAEPYFESLVRVPEKPSRRLRGGEDQTQARSSEWKQRWAIISDGFLNLCKDSQLVPTQQFPISSITKLCGPDTLGIKPSSNSHVICAKFDRSAKPLRTNGDADGVPMLQRKQKLKSGSWVILEMPDRSSYENIIRVLHRLAPYPLRLSSPQTPLPSPASPSSPIQTSRGSIATSLSATHTLASSSNSTSFYGVQYPEWRLALLAKARMAGRGTTSSAVSLAHASCLIGNRMDREMIHHPLPRAPSISEGLRRRAAEELVSGSEESEAENVRASPWIDALSEEDENGDESDGDVESEIEWDGWMRDLARRERRAPPPITINNKVAHSTIRPGSSAVSPSSPSSSDYDYDMCESSGSLTRQRTLSYARGTRFKGDALHRTRTGSNTAKNVHSTHPWTSTTLTTITTYVDRVPDIHHLSTLATQSTPGSSPYGNNQAPPQSPSSPSSGRPPAASSSSTPFPSSSSSTPSVPSLTTPRGRRVRTPSNGSPSRTSCGAASFPLPPTPLSSSPSPPEPNVDSPPPGGSFGSSSGRVGGGIGGVRRIVRGVSIRNAFSAEKLARGFENALDFVDGR